MEELAEDYDLEYISDMKLKDKLMFRCDKGHIYEQAIGHHIDHDGNRKQGCPFCARERTVNGIVNKGIVKRNNYPKWFIEGLIDANDKERAIKRVLTSNDRVSFKYGCGHIVNDVRVYSVIKNDNGHNRYCGKCYNEILNNSRSYPEWFIDELVNDEDKKNAKNRTLRTRDTVLFKCENGHTYEQTISQHITGSKERKHGCPECAKLKRVNSIKLTKFSKRKYPEWLINEINNNSDKERIKIGNVSSNELMEFKCKSCGKSYTQRLYNHVNLTDGRRKQSCPYCCMKNRSKTEIEIEGYVKSLGYNTEHKRLKDSNGRVFEIDIFVSDKNVGIEYNGSAFHSTVNGVKKNLNKDYHYKKFNACRMLGILLITIFDVEWDTDKEKIKGYIKDILNGNENALSYNRDGYMNNNYPSWKHYKGSSTKYIEDRIESGRFIVYTCGYMKLD